LGSWVTLTDARYVTYREEAPQALASIEDPDIRAAVRAYQARQELLRSGAVTDRSTRAEGLRTSYNQYYHLAAKLDGHETVRSSQLVESTPAGFDTAAARQEALLADLDRRYPLVKRLDWQTTPAELAEYANLVYASINNK
jgi:hypothetical protein